MSPRPEKDLTDWFLMGPVADLFSMANEGLSQEESGLGRFGVVVGVVKTIFPWLGVEKKGEVLQY